MNKYFVEEKQKNKENIAENSKIEDKNESMKSTDETKNCDKSSEKECNEDLSSKSSPSTLNENIHNSCDEEVVHYE